MQWLIPRRGEGRGPGLMAGAAQGEKACLPTGGQWRGAGRGMAGTEAGKSVDSDVGAQDLLNKCSSVRIYK